MLWFVIIRKSWVDVFLVLVNQVETHKLFLLCVGDVAVEQRLQVNVALLMHREFNRDSRFALFEHSADAVLMGEVGSFFGFTETLHSS